MKKILRSLPFQLLIILIFCSLFSHIIPHDIKSIFYAISLSIKELLVFFLPAIVFSYLFSSMLAMHKGALLFVALIVASICISNFISTLIGYSAAHIFLSGSVSILRTSEGATLAPSWVWHLPKFISNDMGLLSGMLAGLFFSYRPNRNAEKIATALKRWANWFLHRLFIPVVPLFVFGFALKLAHDDILEHIVRNYSYIFLIIISALVLYVFFLYGVGNFFRVAPWIASIRRVIPSGLTAFSTMSSAATMPVTLEAAEENTKRPELARAIIPFTVNVHLIGDSIGIPVMAMGILLAFGMPMPDFMHYLPFAVFFVLAKFAVAAVPGGGIMVMLPVIEKYLGFSSEMLSLIMALYILFDPILTAANVLGNGAFAMIISKIDSRVRGNDGK